MPHAQRSIDLSLVYHLTMLFTLISAEEKHDFSKNFPKSIKNYSIFSLKFGLAEFQPGLVFDLFLISDENPG